jgi:hypothetical protein
MARNRSETAQEQHRPSPPHCPCRVPSRLAGAGEQRLGPGPCSCGSHRGSPALHMTSAQERQRPQFSWERCNRAPLLTNQTVTMPRDRTYHIRVPTNPPAATVPVIIVFHGGGHHHRQALGRRSPNPVPADVENYLLVFPVRWRRPARGGCGNGSRHEPLVSGPGQTDQPHAVAGRVGHQPDGSRRERFSLPTSPRSAAS